MFEFLRFYAKLFHFTQTTASPIYKTTFPKWQQRRAATSPLLGSVPQRQLQQGGDGSEKIDLGEDWLVLWTCAGGRVLCFFLSLSLCNHSSLPSLAWETQTSKAAIPLQHYSWVEPIPRALHWALLKHLAQDKKEKERICFFVPVIPDQSQVCLASALRTFQ